MKFFFITFLFFLVLSGKGQSIDVESEQMPGTKRVDVKSFRGCCAEEGYRVVYKFDSKGRATESIDYYKRESLKKHKYIYNNAGLLTDEIQISSINKQKIIDTVHYKYEFSDGLILSKSKIHQNKIERTHYQDFNKQGNPAIIIFESEGKKTIKKREYDSLGRVIRIQEVRNDSLIPMEEMRYNENGDIAYSILVSLVGAKPPIYWGNARSAVVEHYEYVYDRQNRWTEKYVVFNNTKKLFEKRTYK